MVAKQKYSKGPPRSASSSRHLLLTHNSLLTSLKLVLQVRCQPALCLGHVPTALSLLQLLGRRVWWRSLSTGLSQLSFVTDLLCVLVQPFNFSKPITSSVCWDNNSHNNHNNNAGSVRLLWGLKGFERISLALTNELRRVGYWVSRLSFELFVCKFLSVIVAKMYEDICQPLF